MFNHMSVKNRFILLLALFVFAMLVPATVAVRSAWQHMSFAQREEAGLKPVKQMLEVIRLVQQHRGISAVYLGGDTSADTKRRSISTSIDEAMSALEGSLHQDGADASVAGRSWSDNRAQLKEIISKVELQKVSGAESSKLHTMLIGKLLTTLGHVADHWSLTLDPEASTYFLVIATVDQAPAMIELMGQTRARGANLLSQKDGVTGIDRARFENLQVALAAAVHKTNVMMDKASLASRGENEFDVAPINQKFQTFSAKGIDLAKRHVVDPELLTYSSKQYFVETTEVIDAMYVAIGDSFAILDMAFRQRASNSFNTLLGLTGAISALLIAAVLLCFATYRSMWQQLGAEPAELRDAVGRVAAGDLTVHISNLGSSNSVSGAINRMQSELINIVGSVRTNAECVATASSQIAQGNQDLSQRTENQASALQQTASTMTELGHTVNRNADNAKQANQLALEASAIATRGGQVVGEVVDTMKGINDSSNRIADIIGVIDGIAFQTNILALNAAVEAARAGEQGRGFAVVATEVRSLARRSADAAKEIKALISASVDRVEQGSALVDQAGQTMSEIVQSIKRVSDIVGEISLASVDQNSGVGVVGQAIMEMDQSTQQNAALVEQSAAAAESLQRQASELVEIVGTFKLMNA